LERRWSLLSPTSGTGHAREQRDLLNWLAAELMDENWSMKKLHRLVVTSSAYRMDSVYDPADAAIDSENTWLWRMNPRRMEAEVVRDTVLYLGNKLEAGPPGQWLKDDSAAKGDNYRRSLYYGIAQNKILRSSRYSMDPM